MSLIVTVHVVDNCGGEFIGNEWTYIVSNLNITLESLGTLGWFPRDKKKVFFHVNCQHDILFYYFNIIIIFLEVPLQWERKNHFTTTGQQPPSNPRVINPHGWNNECSKHKYIASIFSRRTKFTIFKKQVGIKSICRGRQ